MFDVAIIGAGLAGLTCAQQLHQAGYSVVVLEKSRGVGGRMATRRLHQTCADHGVRYLEPQGKLLPQLIEILVQRNILQAWTDTIYELKPTKLESIVTSHSSPLPPTPQASKLTRYVAPAGMTAVGKFLATGLEVWLNRRVQAMMPTKEQTWHLTLDSMDEAPDELAARAVVVAIPAPQSLMLLEPLAEMGLPPELLNSLNSVEFDPCLSVMAGYSAVREESLPIWKACTLSNDTQDLRIRPPSPPNLGGTGFTPPKVGGMGGQNVGVCVSPDTDLAWIGLDSSKRLDPQMPIFVLQSTAEFAKRYLDAEDLNPAGKQLLSHAAQLLIPWLDTPDWFQVHRWRYAFPSRPLNQDYLNAMTPLPLVCCGDWCGGNLIESAMNSGLGAAAQINSQLQKRSLPGEEFWAHLAVKGGLA